MEAYNRTTWQSGQLITASLMNNLEEQVELLTNNAADNDVVLVQSQQPTSDTNRIWVQPQSGGTQVPTYEEFTDLANGVVRHDEAQSLSDAQKAQARDNIGAADGAEVEELKSAFNAYGPAVTRSLSTSKNLAFISPQYLNREINGITVTLADDGETYVVNGTTTANTYIGLSMLGVNNATAWSKSFIWPKTYTFSFTGISGFNSTRRIAVRYNYAIGTAMTTIVSQTTSNRVKTVTFESVPFIALFFNNGDSYNNCRFKLQIEEGETATEYVAPAGMVDYEARKAIDSLEQVTVYDYNAEKKCADSFEIPDERYDNIEYSELLYDISVIDKRNSVSAEYDTSVRFRNMPRSIKVVTNSTDGYSDVQPTTATPFKMLGVQEVDVAIYISDSTKVSSVRFQTIESGMSRQITTLHNGWNLLRFMTYGSGIDTQGDRDVDTVRWRVRIYTTENITIWIGSVVLVKPDKANLIIIEDAGYKSFYDIAYPAFKAINAPVTWAIDPFVIDATDNKTGDRPKMGIEDMEVLAYDGLSEFSFHNYDGTYMSSATKEQALADTLNCIRWLKKHGYEPQRIFRGAWYQNNCPNHQLADLEMDASASYDGSTGFVMFPFPDRYNIPRYAMQGRDTATIDAFFEVLRKNHNTLLIYTHGISDYEQDTSETLLAYYAQKCSDGIQAGWLNCTTYNRMMNHYRRIR